jgi:hypothetical protein
MRTLGIDLATDPRRTAACLIDWSPDTGVQPVVTSIEVGVTDDRAVELAAHAEFVGIDAPFGWPRAWAAAVAKHRPGATFGVEGTPAGLTRRATDLWVAENTGIYPLSVAANLIGATAIRCARLIHRLGQPIDQGRSPRAPLTSEVYPAAALVRWGFKHQLYKGAPFAAGRKDLIASIVAGGLPIVLGDGDHHLLEASDDALDSLLCSLVARAVAVGLTDDAPASLHDAAATEGWIRIPVPGSSIRMLLHDYPPRSHTSPPA